MLELALVTLLVFQVPTAGTGCNSGSTLITACTSSDGTQVDISAGITAPGVGSSGDSGSSGGGPPPLDAAPPSAGFDPEDCGPLGCRGNYTVLTPPDVTIADLASFRPAAPSVAGQPDGFGVTGMPTNVVAAASEQIIPGSILGWDVLVRFTPSGYVFDYGDGVQSRSATGGSSWESLAQGQFTPTPTSHVYRERGVYPVVVAVEYAAAVDFGSGAWRPVDGVVTARSGTYPVEVVDVRTALVDRSCTEDPLAAGC
ncbi:hypothetical protein ABXJ56_14805 [Microbacterium chocolatum]|uniref:hypothetical protein n=1 Tax=Microbacterium aurantiacum TaxID=162393 RepID=UPI00338EA34B